MQTIRRLLRMARNYHPAMLGTVFALLGAALLQLVMPFLVQHLTAALTDKSATPRYICAMAGILLGSYILRAICRFFAMWLAHVGAWNFVGSLTLRVYDKLQQLSMAWYAKQETGQIMSRILNDTRNLELLFAHALPDMLTNLLILCLVSIMLFTIHPLLAFFTLLPLPFIFAVSCLYS